MSLVTLKTALRTAVQDLVVEAASVPCWFDNVNSGDRPNSVHAEVEIRLDDAEQVSSGGSGTRRYRVRGELRFQTFVPAGSGESALDAALNSIESAFRGVTIDSVVFESPVSRRRGRVDRWWAWYTACPFYYDFFA